jgi:hypothetical protein
LAIKGLCRNVKRTVGPTDAAVQPFGAIPTVDLTLSMKPRRAEVELRRPPALLFYSVGKKRKQEVGIANQRVTLVVERNGG